MPINLYKKLRSRNPHIKYVVILDNLFLNIPIAYVLLKYDIGYLGTIRKNTDGFLSDLIEAKNHNKLFKWGEDVSIEVRKVLYFLQQDNNTVLSATTTFSMHKAEDYVVKSRKRLKKTLTNAVIVYRAFKGAVRKDLPIPRLIDVYNHYINGINLTN